MTATVGVALVAVAIIVPHWGIEALTPLIGGGGTADAAPIFGWWSPHVGWGTPVAVLTGVVVIAWGPALARRLSWRSLTLAVWATHITVLDLSWGTFLTATGSTAGYFASNLVRKA